MNSGNALEIAFGILVVVFGLLTKDFRRLGFSIQFIYKNRMPPRWLYGAVYCGVGIALIYQGISNWHR
jgi:hypothetical protein